VPITAIATTLYQKRHPGIVVVDGEGTGLDPLMRTVLMFGTVSFMVLFVGLSMLSDSVLRLEDTAEKAKRRLD
jgi:hypothetical protein